MDIAIVAFAQVFRYFSPHVVWPAIAGFPWVPLLTVLMGLAVFIAMLRRTISPRVSALHFVQWTLCAWAFVSVLVNAGSEGLRLETTSSEGRLSFLSSDFIKDLVFVTVMSLSIDRLPRFKLVVASVVTAFLLIATFALPQTWSPRYCAEWKSGDMANLVFAADAKCVEVTDCFTLETRIPRAFEGIGDRNWRCERRGPFGIAAYIGRARWVGVFDDSNNLGGSVAFTIPLLLAWLSRSKHRWARRALPLMVLTFVALIVTTGSRGSQLGLLAGSGLAAVLLWGRKAVYAGIVVAVLAGGALLTVGKTTVREEGRFEGNPEVSDRYRREAMEVGFRLWRTRPFFGVGYHRFRHYHIIDPHNAWLCSAGELGTVGILLYGLSMWMIFKSVLQIRRRARAAGHEELARLATGLLGANTTALISLTFFLSTYPKLSWLVPMGLNMGFLRAAERELPDYRLQLTLLDVGLSICATLLLAGFFYVGIMLSATLN